MHILTANYLSCSPAFIHARDLALAASQFLSVVFAMHDLLLFIPSQALS